MRERHVEADAAGDDATVGARELEELVADALDVPDARERREALLALARRFGERLEQRGGGARKAQELRQRLVGDGGEPGVAERLESFVALGPEQHRARAGHSDDHPARGARAVARDLHEPLLDDEQGARRHARRGARGALAQYHRRAPGKGRLRGLTLLVRNAQQQPAHASTSSKNS